MNLKKKLNLKNTILFKNQLLSDFKLKFDFQNYNKGNLSIIMQEEYFKKSHKLLKEKFIKVFKYTEYLEVKIKKNIKELEKMKNINYSLNYSKNHREKVMDNLTNYNIKLKSFYLKINENKNLNLNNINISQKILNKRISMDKNIIIKKSKRIININNSKSSNKNIKSNYKSSNFSDNKLQSLSILNNSLNNTSDILKLQQNIIFNNEIDRILKYIFNKKTLYIKNFIKTNKKFNWIFMLIKEEYRLKEYVINMKDFELTELFESIKIIFVL